MKKNYMLILALIILIGSIAINNTNKLFLHAQPANVNTKDLPKVIIDAGHGGEDGGAVKGDIVEKDINLSIALKLKEFIKASGYEVIMIRETDISIHDEDATSIRKKKNTDLKNRLKLMNSYPDGIYISIHQNIYSESRYKGLQVFYAPNVDESKVLAECIQQSTKQLLQKENNREIKKCGDDVYIIYNAEIPAVLVECGFMSNPTELSLLTSDDYQNQLAFAILNGILNYSAV